jgi:hypothetical protein
MIPSRAHPAIHRPAGSVPGAAECVAPRVGLVEAVSAASYSADAAGNVTHTYRTTARLVSGPAAP